MPDLFHMRTLPDLLAYHAQVRPDAIALQFEGHSTTYASFHREVYCLAASLNRLVVDADRRIAYLGKNSARYFELVFAAAQAGLVVVPLNWRLTEDEWSFILRDANATHLFVDAAFEEQGQQLGARIGLRAVHFIEQETTWQALVGPNDSASALKCVHADDVVVQIYTSGTTGTPKGAMLSHTNLLALREPGLRAGFSWFPRDGDTSLVVMPVAHIAGTAYGLFGLHTGGRLVISREFNAGEAWQLLADSGATHMLLAPAALRMLMEHPSAATASLPRFRYLTYGGSPISPTFLAQCIARLRCGFTQMYGMTEASGGISALTPDDHLAATPERLASAGRAMPGVELAVVDPHGRHLAAGAIGEVVVRSRAVMTGYWKRSQATSEAIDADGWLRTGDIGSLDEEGYLYVLDRAKDVIITGAENVYPLEVENLLLRHPAIADVAVIGVPSERWGEEVKAVVVARRDLSPGQIDTTAIVAWAKEHLASYKVPKSFDFVAELPRNANGKVLRRHLREPYWRGHVKRVS